MRVSPFDKYESTDYGFLRELDVVREADYGKEPIICN
jgi:hypothetical protein